MFWLLLFGMKAWHVAGADADLEGAVVVGRYDEEGVSADGESEVGEVGIDGDGEPGLLGVDEAGRVRGNLKFLDHLPAEDVLDSMSLPCHGKGGLEDGCRGPVLGWGFCRGASIRGHGFRGGGPTEVEPVVYGLKPQVEAGNDGA